MLYNKPVKSFIALRRGNGQAFVYCGAVPEEDYYDC